jgi:hypothetical protein
MLRHYSTTSGDGSVMVDSAAVSIQLQPMPFIWTKNWRSQPR